MSVPPTCLRNCQYAAASAALALAAALVAPGLLAATATADAVTLRQADPKTDPAEGQSVSSTYDTQTRSYSLVLTTDGVPQVLPVGVRSHPFDASLGTDSAGKAVVTFTTCGHYSTNPSILSAQRDCEVRQYTVASRATKTLRTQPAKNDAMWLPVVAHGTLVYARLNDRGTHGRGKSRVHAYRYEIVRRTSKGRVQRFKGSPRSAFDVDTYAGQSVSSSGSGPSSLAFDGRHVAYSWEEQPTPVNCPDQAERGGGFPQASTVYYEFRGKRTVVARGCDTGGKSGPVSDVSITSRGLQWYRSGVLQGPRPFT